MVTQSESPRFNNKVFKEVYEVYRGIFGQDNVLLFSLFLLTQQVCGLSHIVQKVQRIRSVVWIIKG